MRNKVVDKYVGGPHRPHNTTRQKIKDLCIEGLEADGGHHKQWYLERILEELGHDLEELRKKEQELGYDWEPGTAP